MINSSRSSAAVCDSLRIPRSSMMSSGTAASSARKVLRVPSRVASVRGACALRDRTRGSPAGSPRGRWPERDGFPHPWWPEKKSVLALRDEPAGGELVDERAIHLLVEIEIEAVERWIRI